MAILGKWGSYQIRYHCEHLELSPLVNSGLQFQTRGQWARIFIHHLFSLIEWLILLGTLAFVHFWPALHKAKHALQPGKENKTTLKQRITNVCTNQPSEWRDECGRVRLGSDIYYVFPSFLLVKCIFVCQTCVYPVLFFLHSFLHFHNLWLISANWIPTKKITLKNTFCLFGVCMGTAVPLKLVDWRYIFGDIPSPK